MWVGLVVWCELLSVAVMILVDRCSTGPKANLCSVRHQAQQATLVWMATNLYSVIICCFFGQKDREPIKLLKQNFTSLWSKGSKIYIQTLLVIKQWEDLQKTEKASEKTRRTMVPRCCYRWYWLTLQNTSARVFIKLWIGWINVRIPCQSYKIPQ